MRNNSRTRSAATEVKKDGLENDLKKKLAETQQPDGRQNSVDIQP